MFKLEKLLQKVQQTGATRQQFVKYFHIMKESKSSFQGNAAVRFSLPGDLSAQLHVIRPYQYP